MLLLTLVKSAISLDVAANFTLTNIDGVQFSLSDYRGKVVLLDFFATICAPCVEEIPVLKLLHQEFNETVVIISISISPEIDTVEKLQLFRQENEINWTIARDTAEVNSDYGINTIPTLIIVDQEGYIRYQHVGLTEQQVLQGEVNEVVPEFGWLSIVVVLTLFSAMVITKRRSLFGRKSQRTNPAVRNDRSRS
jgi:thiol-disulfide isomerase/thioredoxin